MARVSTVVILVALAVVGSAKSLDWWKTSVIYQIYPRSFKDSNGDGVGDLNGITQKLPYLQELGVGAILLGPIFQSPMVDFGYDVSDYRVIDPVFGTIDDFDNLLKKAHEFHLKVILDYVPNHSSDEHEWFLKSIKGTAPYADYYVWQDGKPNSNNNSQPSPPNNWKSAFGGSAWEWNSERHQYYLHQYSKQQPDLNYRNPAVVNEMKDILKFWLQKGVDGFRLDAVYSLFEDPKFQDEPLSNNPKCAAEDACSLQHIYTKNLNESISMVQQWRRVLDSFKQNSAGKTTRLLIGEPDSHADMDHIVAFYGNTTHPGAHFPFNFLLLKKITNESKAMDISYAFHQWHDYMHNGRWDNWLLGNHDNSRMASRLGCERVDAMHMLLLLLPGTAISYYGEELGMVDTPLTWEQTVDIKAHNAGKIRYSMFSRDPERTPFQWNSSISAGFSSNSSTWLPVNPNYKELNLLSQKTDKRSHFRIYQRLVAMRNEESSVQKGDLTTHVISDYVITFSRHASDHDTFVVVINFGDTKTEVNLKEYNLPKMVLVHTASVNSKFHQTDRVNPRKLEMSPYSAVVLTTGKVRDYVYRNSAMSSYRTFSTVILGSVLLTVSLFFWD